MKPTHRTICIHGGLGNQLFQYAYGRNLIEKGKHIILNLSFFKENKIDTPRTFLLKNFNIHESIIFTEKKETLFKKIINKIYSQIDKDYGFFQSEDYFKQIESIIHKEFTLKNPLSPTAQDFANQINANQNSVSIHIRRGDYVSNVKANKYHGTCSLEYYQKAISVIKTDINLPTFFVFSDDINWVKENLGIDNVSYVSNPDLTECEELLLMSYCKHNIIANSTFSWWGAWLNQNPNKIVVAPKQWSRHKTSDQLNILPKSWMQI